MKTKIKQHYDNLSAIYEQLWTYSDDFVFTISKQIIEQLELKESDILVDYGCGTGIYSKAILKQIHLQNDIICTDLSEKMLANLKGKIGIQTFVKDAIEFSEMNLQYDKVFIKEMIHHVKKGRHKIYENVYRNLNSNGIFIILLLPPKIEYPLFDMAMEYYEKSQPHFSTIEQGMKNAGFDMEINFIEYPLQIEKERYYTMIRNRYMSLLSQYSDVEIENGIKELEKKYVNHTFFSFKDKFVVLKGRK